MVRLLPIAEFCRFIIPALVIAPIVSLVKILSVPAEATVTALASFIAAPPVSDNVPPLIVVRPVYVFAPDKINSPEPIFSSGFAPPISEIMPDCSAEKPVRTCNLVSEELISI